jgi:hypothetical protein
MRDNNVKRGKPIMKLPQLFGLRRKVDEAEMERLENKFREAKTASREVWVQACEYDNIPTFPVDPKRLSKRNPRRQNVVRTHKVVQAMDAKILRTYKRKKKQEI